MQKNVRSIAASLMVFLASLFMVFATVVLCVQLFAFNRNFYASEYAKYNVKDDVGVSEQTLTNATDRLLGYLEGSYDSLDMEMEQSAEQYYTQREKDHMVDVKLLYQNARAFMVWAYVLGAAAICISWLLTKDKKRIFKAAFLGISAAMAAFVVLGIWAAVDFNHFWISFHRLFFTNDLWILDPSVSFMIRMFPQAFFFDLVIAILALFFVIILVAWIIVGVLGKKNKTKKERKQHV